MVGRVYPKGNHTKKENTMTHQNDCTLQAELLEQIAEQDLDYLPELIRIVINAAMQAERQKYLGVSLYVRSTECQGHSNGYKPKTVSTRIVPITFDIPQVREGGLHPGLILTEFMEFSGRK